MVLSRFFKRLRMIETDCGRDAGWIAEWDGRPVAVLTQPRWEEMFWDSYQLEVIADDPTLRAKLEGASFWAGNECLDLVWRSREFGLRPMCAYPSTNPFQSEPGRIMMRGLHVLIGAPWVWPWEWIALAIRRWWRKRRHSLIF